jgi:hypothetical protein
VVIAMGSRAFGTEAAARFLTTSPFRPVARALGHGHPRWAILDVDIVNQAIAGITLLENQQQPRIGDSTPIERRGA